MADNTEQFDWIVRIVSNLKHLLKDQDAFVAGDLLWYPVEVESNEKPPSQAPDALVALGRPKGRRGSYKQWEEGGIAPQVVFEILSPSNTRKEMAQKQKFYEDHGVLEAYYYDPKRKDFWGYVRETPDEVCTLITARYLPWVSPLLHIRFELPDELEIFYPNGELFKGLDDVTQERDQMQVERDQIQAKLDQAIARMKAAGIDPSDL